MRWTSTRLDNILQPGLMPGLNWGEDSQPPRGLRHNVDRITIIFIIKYNGNIKYKMYTNSYLHVVIHVAYDNTLTSYCFNNID